MRKWFMLTIFCALVFINGYAFSAISTVPDKAEDYYDESEVMVNLFVEMFYIVYLPFAPFAAWLLTKSLHNCLIVCYTLTMIGCWIKYLAFSMFWLALCGQIIICSVTSVILTAISVVSEIWFPKEQQLLAITLSELLSFLAMGVGFILAPNISIEDNNLFQAVYATVIFSFYIAFARKDPVEQDLLSLGKFFSEVKAMATDWVHMGLVIAVGAVTGLSYSFLGLIAETLKDQGITEDDSGYIGFAIAMTGMFGGLTVTYIESKEVNVNLTLIVFASGTGVSLFLWCFFARTLIADYVVGSAVGFFYFGVIPLGLRISNLHNPKIIETIPTGVVFLTAQIFALGFSYPIIYSDSYDIHSLWVVLALYIFIVTLLILLIIKAANDVRQRTISESLNLPNKEPPLL